MKLAIFKLFFLKFVSSELLNLLIMPIKKYVFQFSCNLLSSSIPHSPLTVHLLKNLAIWPVVSHNLDLADCIFKAVQHVLSCGFPAN